MSRVILTERARSDLARLYEFLNRVNTDTATKAIDTIVDSFGLLEQLPLTAPLVDGRNDIRKFVIAFGQSGYIAFYEYDHLTDTVVIATITHQKEHYFFETIGRI